MGSTLSVTQQSKHMRLLGVRFFRACHEVLLIVDIWVYSGKGRACFSEVLIAQGFWVRLTTDHRDVRFSEASQTIHKLLSKKKKWGLERETFKLGNIKDLMGAWVYLTFEAVSLELLCLKGWSNQKTFHRVSEGHVSLVPLQEKLNMEKLNFIHKSNTWSLGLVTVFTWRTWTKCLRRNYVSEIVFPQCPHGGLGKSPMNDTWWRKALWAVIICEWKRWSVHASFWSDLHRSGETVLEF